MKRTDKVYRVTITSIPLNYFDYQIEQKTLLRVPYDVEINKKILENSGYFDDWWEDGMELHTYPLKLNPKYHFVDWKWVKILMKIM